MNDLTPEQRRAQLRLATVMDPARAGRPTLAKAELQEIAEGIRVRIRRTVADIIETGRDLARVKAALDHGEFTDWIEREFSMSIRTAQNYMQAFELTSGKSETVALLPPATLYKLAARSTPEELKAEVISTLKSGKSIDPRQIEARIGMARSEHRIAARQKLQRATRSPAAKRRREREKERWEAEERARKERIDQAVAEAVQILLKLPPEDLERLVKLMGEGAVGWHLQEALGWAIGSRGA